MQPINYYIHKEADALTFSVGFRHLTRSEVSSLFARFEELQRARGHELVHDRVLYDEDQPQQKAMSNE